MVLFDEGHSAEDDEDDEERGRHEIILYKHCPLQHLYLVGSSQRDSNLSLYTLTPLFVVSPLGEINTSDRCKANSDTGRNVFHNIEQKNNNFCTRKEMKFCYFPQVLVRVKSDYY